MSDALSAQGTLIARAPAATPTVFTTIAELRDITPPPLTRNPIETTSHNEDEESFVVGIKRKGDNSFGLEGNEDYPGMEVNIRVWTI